MWRNNVYIFLCLYLSSQVTVLNGFTIPFSSFSSSVLPRRPSNSSLSSIKRLPSVLTNTFPNYVSASNICNVKADSNDYRGIKTVNPVKAVDGIQGNAMSSVHNRMSPARPTVSNSIPPLTSYNKMPSKSPSIRPMDGLCSRKNNSPDPNTVNFLYDPMISVRLDSLSSPIIPASFRNTLPTTECLGKKDLPLTSNVLDSNIRKLDLDKNNSPGLFSPSIITSTNANPSSSSQCLNSIINNFPPNWGPISPTRFVESDSITLPLRQTNLPFSSQNIETSFFSSDSYLPLRNLNSLNLDSSLLPPLVNPIPFKSTLNKIPEVKSCQSNILTDTNRKLKVKSLDLKMLPLPSCPIDTPLQGMVKPLRNNKNSSCPDDGLKNNGLINPSTKQQSLSLSIKPEIKFLSSNLPSGNKMPLDRPCPQIPSLYSNLLPPTSSYFQSPLSSTDIPKQSPSTGFVPPLVKNLLPSQPKITGEFKTPPHNLVYTENTYINTPLLVPTSETSQTYPASSSEYQNLGASKSFFDILNDQKSPTCLETLPQSFKNFDVINYHNTLLQDFKPALQTPSPNDLPSIALPDPRNTRLMDPCACEPSLLPIIQPPSNLLLSPETSFTNNFTPIDSVTQILHKPLNNVVPILNISEGIPLSIVDILIMPTNTSLLGKDSNLPSSSFPKVNNVNYFYNNINIPQIPENSLAPFTVSPNKILFEPINILPMEQIVSLPPVLSKINPFTTSQVSSTEVFLSEGGNPSNLQVIIPFHDYNGPVSKPCTSEAIVEPTVNSILPKSIINPLTNTSSYINEGPKSLDSSSISQMFVPIPTLPSNSISSLSEVILLPNIEYLPTVNERLIKDVLSPKYLGPCTVIENIVIPNTPTSPISPELSPYIVSQEIFIPNCNPFASVPYLVDFLPNVITNQFNSICLSPEVTNQPNSPVVFNGFSDSPYILNSPYYNVDSSFDSSIVTLPTDYIPQNSIFDCTMPNYLPSVNLSPSNNAFSSITYKNAASTSEQSSHFNNLAKELTNTFLNSNKIPSIQQIPTVATPLLTSTKSKHNSKQQNFRRMCRKTTSESKTRHSDNMLDSPFENSSRYTEYPNEVSSIKASNEPYSVSILQNSLDALSSFEFDDSPSYYNTDLDSTISLPSASKSNVSVTQESSTDTAENLVHKLTNAESYSNVASLKESVVKDFDFQNPEEIVEYIVLKELLNSDVDSNWDLLEKIIHVLCFNDNES